MKPASSSIQSSTAASTPERRSRSPANLKAMQRLAEQLPSA
jgi:hypothetical protein